MFSFISSFQIQRLICNLINKYNIYNICIVYNFYKIYNIYTNGSSYLNLVNFVTYVYIQNIYIIYYITPISDTLRYIQILILIYKYSSFEACFSFCALHISFTLICQWAGALYSPFAGYLLFSFFLSFFTIFSFLFIARLLVYIS